MNRRERARTYRRPLVVPPMPIGEPPTPVPANRAPIGWAALRAGFTAHKGATHGGHTGRGCRTCARYLEALVTARVAVNASPTDAP
jgi:hypothetical protein